MFSKIWGEWSLSGDEKSHLPLSFWVKEAKIFHLGVGYPSNLKKRAYLPVKKGTYAKKGRDRSRR